MSGGRKRGLLVVMLVLGVSSMGLRIAAETGSGWAGVLGSLGLVAFGIGVGVPVRRRAEAKVATALDSDGPVTIDGGLDCSCLPEPWPALAAETLSWATTSVATASGLPVRVRIEGLMLHFEKRQLWLTGRQPFAAEVPLAAVRAVRADRPRVALVGSSLTFGFDDGPVSLDIALGREAAQRVADRFQARATSARRAPGPPTPGRLVVTSPRPRVRTSPGRAFVMLALTFGLWLAALAGGEDGVGAVVATSVLFFPSVFLVQVRPRRMADWMSRGCLVVAIAFAVDAVVSGQPPRLAGVIVAAVCGLVIARLGPDGHAATG